MRYFLIAIATLLLASAPPEPQPPAPLEPYFKGGRFEPGDYQWLRGRFADAPTSAKAEWAQINAWLTACTSAESERIKRELQALGVANPKITPAPYQDRDCGAATSFWLTGDELANFERFRSALAEAQPIAQTIIWTTGLAERATAARDNSLRSQLLARPIGEQILRSASGWGEGEAADAPSLSPLARQLVRTLIGKAFTERDHANTDWLKSKVAVAGWPTISAVGKPAANAAWLLAQHADSDPVFQLQVLRLMEPLAAKGEADKRDYAYLYDRVILKIAGKQRYATQFWCKDGAHQPQPLENEAEVDRLRSSMNLEPLETYRAQMREMFGSGGCK